MSLEPPEPPRRRRGLLIAGSMAAVALVAGGLAVSQLALADDDPATAASPSTTGDGTADSGTVDSETASDSGTSDAGTTDSGTQPDGRDEHGRHRGPIEPGDLGRLQDCLGIDVPFLPGPGDDGERGDQDAPPRRGPLGGWLGALGDGSHVAVLGPDGVSVVDLGDGDGSVTITQQDGDVSISTDGGATVRKLSDVLDDWAGRRDRADGGTTDPSSDQPGDEAPGRPAFPRLDPGTIRSCLDDDTGGAAGS